MIQGHLRGTAESEFRNDVAEEGNVSCNLNVLACFLSKAIVAQGRRVPCTNRARICNPSSNFDRTPGSLVILPEPRYSISKSIFFCCLDSDQKSRGSILFGKLARSIQVASDCHDSVTGSRRSLLAEFRRIHWPTWPFSCTVLMLGLLN
jgi:hypothetical protein